jgi:hypothetical protein
MSFVRLPPPNSTPRAGCNRVAAGVLDEPVAWGLGTTQDVRGRRAPPAPCCSRACAGAMQQPVAQLARDSIQPPSLLQSDWPVYQQVGPGQGLVQMGGPCVGAAWLLAGRWQSACWWARKQQVLAQPRGPQAVRAPEGIYHSTPIRKQAAQPPNRHLGVGSSAPGALASSGPMQRPAQHCAGCGHP